MKTIAEMEMFPARRLGATGVSRGKNKLGSNSDDEDVLMDFSTSPPPPQKWKGKEYVQEQEELMPDVISFKGSCDSDEGGPSSFAGASHPPEPVDIDLMKPVFVPITRKKTEGRCLIKGACLEDVSRKLSELKPVSSPVSSLQIVADGPRASQEKECVWDTSLPPSGNVSPLSSIDSLGIVHSCASTTYQSDGMLSIDTNFFNNGKEIIESARTSMSRPSESSNLSDDSNWSSFTSGANKPHKGNDPRWKAIYAIRTRDGVLGMNHFRLLKRLGCGDIGSVYLSELSTARCYFAMKVMDKASLASRKKLTRAQTEREILQLLDHPFLPTLYTHFETDRFSCLVMEFCPGGDLHTLRQRQPGKHFSEYAAKFYAAEVLLAIEYLHMLGVVYRDLKPENVLVREDGHIMLSDFDLSLRCAFSPTLIRSLHSGANGGAFCVQPACIEPASTAAACIQPACFLPKLFSPKKKKNAKAPTVPELLAEPTAARSMSFVGTHEYLAPEIIKGEGHGSVVDWWTFGVFLHELLYGKTPFKGSGNRATLFNVVGQQLKFPESPATSYAARDLIRGLLVKEPQQRLGVKRGATEIKQHPFFQGVNWALIRCSTPPEVPRPVEMEPSSGPGPAVGVGNVSKRVAGGEPQPTSGGVERYMMERCSRLLKIPLCHGSEAYYNVAASLCLTPSKTLQVPTVNAIFFSGDRVRGTGNPVIEKLSNLQQIAEILVSKFGSSVNAWVIEASIFTRGFAVYKDFVPSVNEFGEPSSYNPSGFPASSSIVQLLSQYLIKVENEIRARQKDSAQATTTAANSTCPKTIILGFSKGGIVLNQLITELASSPFNSNANPHNINHNHVIPSSKERFLDSITEIHYVDVGLNSPGAYLTNQDAIKELSTRAELSASCIRFMIHGTPRQWSDTNRTWIHDEKDKLVRLLETESRASHGKLAVRQRLYFGDRSPNLQMHFEIIEALEVSSRLS